MCRRVTCPQCGKPTFAGCGQHVEQVLGNVPQGERCQCGREGKSANRLGTWLRKVLGQK